MHVKKYTQKYMRRYKQIFRKLCKVLLIDCVYLTTFIFG